MNEAGVNTFDMRDIYTNSSLDLLPKFRISNKSTQIKRYVPIGHHKNHLSQDGNNQKLRNKEEHVSLSLKKNQKKLRQQHSYNYLMEERPLQDKYRVTT